MARRERKSESGIDAGKMIFSLHWCAVVAKLVGAADYSNHTNLITRIHKHTHTHTHGHIWQKDTHCRRTWRRHAWKRPLLHDKQSQMVNLRVYVGGSIYVCMYMYIPHTHTVTLTHTHTHTELLRWPFWVYDICDICLMKIDVWWRQFYFFHATPKCSGRQMADI